MAFIFSTSHLPETRVQRPDEDEDDEDMQPMPRAGGVRAFSHLPQPALAQAYFPDALSTRPATPVGPPRPHTEPDDDQDTDLAPEPDSDHEDDTTPQDHADDRPWYMPRLSPKDLPPHYRHEDAYATGLNHGTTSTRSSSFDDTPPAPTFRDEADGQISPQGDNRPPQTTSLSPAYPDSRHPASGQAAMQQAGVGPSTPSAQQRIQESQRSIAALKDQMRESNPPADSRKPAAEDQATSPYQGEASNKSDEGRAASPQNTPEIKDTRALRPLRPGRSTDPGEPLSIERDKIEDEMTKLLRERRAAYDKQKEGNMPLSTDELTRLMELDYQRGLAANTDGWGMTPFELMFNADDAYLYHTEPDEKKHPGHEGFRGSGFALEESLKPRYDNPHIKPMIRGKSDPYFSWEINYNVVGQWLRIAGYSKAEAVHFLAAWLAKSPSKWKSLNLDRQTWFWVGYNYADARQKGWHPAGHAPGPKPGNDGWVTPPPASYPSRPQERRRF